MEDWLYDEGEDEKKSTYVAKLTELKAKGNPIEARAADEQTRPGRVLGGGILVQGLGLSQAYLNTKP